MNSGSRIELPPDQSEMMDKEKRAKHFEYASKMISIAKEDIERADLAYKRKDYPETIYKIQQSSEKLAKGLSTLLYGVEPEEHKKISHKTPKVFVNMVKHPLVALIIDKAKEDYKLNIRSDIDIIIPLLNDENFLENLRKTSYEEIIKPFKFLDKLENEYGGQIEGIFLTILTLLGQKKTKFKFSSLIVDSLRLYLIGSLSFPHENQTRYPDRVDPKEYYTDNLGIVKAAPLFIEILKNCSSDIEELIKFYKEIYGL